MGYKLRGVPHAFDTREEALSFLRHSPGYRERQKDYLKRFWPSLYREVSTPTRTSREAGRRIGRGAAEADTRGDGLFDGLGENILRGVVGATPLKPLVMKQNAPAVKKVARKAPELADRAVRPVRDFVRDATAGLGVVVGTGGDPRKVRDLKRRSATQTAGLNEAGILKASEVAGETLGNFVGNQARGLLGMPAVPFALATDPVGTVKGAYQAQVDPVKKLLKGDTSQLVEHPDVFFNLAWAAAGLGGGALAAAGRGPGRVARVEVDGGGWTRPTSPNMAARALGNALNRISEEFPEVPVAGAQSRALRQIQIFRERELDRLQAKAKQYARKHRRIKDDSPEGFAFVQLADHGWATPAERANAAAMTRKEIAQKRDMLARLARRDDPATVEVGTWVRADDRGNYGRVTHVGPDGADVYFSRRRDKRSETKTLPVEALTPVPRGDVPRWAQVSAQRLAKSLEFAVQQLEAALPHIENPSPALQSALRDGRLFADEVTETMTRSGLLTPEAAAERVGLHGRIVEGARFVDEKAAAAERRFYEQIGKQAPAAAQRARGELVAPLEKAASQVKDEAIKAENLAARQRLPVVTEAEQAANAVAQQSRASRVKIAREIEAAQRRVASLERNITRAASAHDAANVARLGAELNQARKNLARLRTGYKREQRVGAAAAAQQEFSGIAGTEARLEQEGVWRRSVVQAVAGREASRGLSQAAERAAAEIDARLAELTRAAEEAAANVKTGYTEAHYTPGESAFFTKDYPRQKRIAKPFAPSASMRLPRGPKQNRGVLFTQGRNIRGPGVVARHAAEQAKDAVQLVTIQKLTDEFAKPYEGTLLPDHELFNPEGISIPRRINEEDMSVLQHPSEALTRLEADRLEAIQNLFPVEPVEGVLQLPVWVGDSIRGGKVYVAGLQAAPAFRLFKQIAIDIPNNLFRLGIYTASPVKYLATNVPSNVLLLSLQAVRHPVAFTQAMKIYREIDKDLLPRLDSEAGSGSARALSESTAGPLKGFTDATADLMNRLADTVWRRQALLTEMVRTAKVRSAADVRALLDDPARRDLLDVISRDTENTMVGFRHMSPGERTFLSSWIAVYAWMRGATKWSWRFPVDHPAQYAVASALGQEGYRQVEETMGKVASFLKEYVPWTLDPVGTIKAAFEGDWQSPIRESKPYRNERGQLVVDVSNPATLLPTSTAMKVGGALSSFVGGGDREAGLVSAAQLASPGPGALLTAGTGYDSLGRPADQGYPERLLTELTRFGLGGLIGRAAQPPGGGRYFTADDREDVARSALVGGLRTRTMKLDPARKKGAEQGRDDVPRERRLLSQALQHEQAVAKRKWGRRVKLPRPVVEDLLVKSRLDAELEELRSSLRKEGIDKLPVREKAKVYERYFKEKFGSVPNVKNPSERYVDWLRDQMFPALKWWGDLTRGSREG